MNRIAKALGLVPSPHVRDLLLEMVEAGDLTVEWRDQSGRYTTRFYLLAEKRIITEKFSRRHISLKKRGVVVGQLDMFS